LRRKLAENQAFNSLELVELNSAELNTLEIESKSNLEDKILVTNSKSVEQLIFVDIEPQGCVEGIKPLINADLAKRLNVDASNLTKYRKLESQKFAIYSASKDPDKLAWKYSEVDKLYYPIIPNSSQNSRTGSD
jgi:hypothetical protein